MTANPIERLDVPATDVVAATARIAKPADDDISAGLSAEYRHLLYDADPDATTRPFIEIHHHASTRRSTR